MKTNLSELRRASRRLWNELRASDEPENVFYILSLMLIQHLSFSNELKRSYFRNNMDFFGLMLKKSRLDEEVNGILKNFSIVNPSLALLTKRTDFRKIGRTQERRDKAISSLMMILTDMQKRIEVRRINESMRFLTGKMMEYYFWAKKSNDGEREIKQSVKKLLFSFSNAKSSQCIYLPSAGNGEGLEGIDSLLCGEKGGKINLFGSSCQSDDFAVFVLLQYFFSQSCSFEATLRSKTCFEEPFADEAGKLMKFDMIVAMPERKIPTQRERKLMKQAEGLLTVKLGNENDRTDFFLSFMLSSLNDDGVLNMIVPYSFLTSEENSVRKYLVDNDLLFHVENLPLNVFTGESFPAAFISIRMKKSDEIRGMTVFRAGREGKNKLVSNKKIADNRYNLSVSRYVSPSVPVQRGDVKTILDRLDRISSEIRSRIYDLGFLTDDEKIRDE